MAAVAEGHDVRAGRHALTAGLAAPGDEGVDGELGRRERLIDRVDLVDDLDGALVRPRDELARLTER